MCRLSLCSNKSRIFRRGNVALRPMLLRSDGLLNGASRTGTRIRYDTFFSNRPDLSGFLAMRHFLISALFISLLAGCSGFRIGPHHIDVQQGNALDQDNVARLKPGLNRAQVRFLLGTPLVVDPFRTDRWDYVYLYYKAGKLTEQKHTTLIFEGDTRARIEGDVPQSVLQQAAEPRSAPQAAAVPAATAVAAVEPAVAAPAAAAPATEEPVTSPAAVAAEPAKAPTVSPSVAAPMVMPVAQAQTTQAESASAAQAQAVQAGTASASSTSGTSLVPPLPSPPGAPPYVDPRPVPELSLKSETDVMQIRPDVVPPFPDPHAATVASNDTVLKAVNAWAEAWRQRDSAAYVAAYDAAFVPQDGGSHAAWEASKRKALSGADSIEVKIDSPSVKRTGDDTATVNFKQYYRSGAYHDAVVKQLRLRKRGDRWVIVEEKVLSILKDDQP